MKDQQDGPQAAVLIESHQRVSYSVSDNHIPPEGKPFFPGLRAQK